MCDALWPRPADHSTTDVRAGGRCAAPGGGNRLGKFISADPIRMIRRGSEEMMSKRLLATVSFVGLLAGLTTMGANAQTATLNGKVSSAEEGLMEGVLVSAKKEGSTVTTTVVSNAKGEFRFPADRIEPGRHNVTIRAAGYVLAGPKQVDV